MRGCQTRNSSTTSLQQRRARHGNEIYESQGRAQVEADNYGKIVVINIETEEFEVGDTVMAATDRLFEHIPNAQPLTIRIGHRAVYHFGSWSLKQN